jgi:hypothetical protein
MLAARLASRQAVFGSTKSFTTQRTASSVARVAVTHGSSKSNSHVLVTMAGVAAVGAFVAHDRVEVRL